MSDFRHKIPTSLISFILILSLLTKGINYTSNQIDNVLHYNNFKNSLWLLKLKLIFCLSVHAFSRLKKKKSDGNQSFQTKSVSHLDPFHLFWLVLSLPNQYPANQSLTWEESNIHSNQKIINKNKSCDIWYFVCKIQAVSESQQGFTKVSLLRMYSWSY